MAEKRGLGRGFDSLIPTQLVEEEFDVTAKADDALREVDPGKIDPNPQQPRADFNQAELAELAESLKVHGVLQPLIVTQVGERYQLIAGERRLRAAKLSKLATVPVIVRSYDEQQKLELALIENLQRADLNPIETATAYRKLVDQFNLSGEQLAKRVGKGNSTVVNTMRLLNLPIEVKRLVSEGALSEGHARAILSLTDPSAQQELAELIVARGLTVRQAEEYARAAKDSPQDKAKAEARISGTSPLTQSLGDYLGTKVTQQATAKGGKLIIEYYSDEELERIYQTIRGSQEEL